MEAEASAAEQGRPARGIALIQVDGALQPGAMLNVVVNVTAAEQARPHTARAAAACHVSASHAAAGALASAQAAGGGCW